MIVKVRIFVIACLVVLAFAAENASAVSDVAGEVRALLAEQLEVEESELRLEADLYQGLGADELDMDEIIMRVEEKFDIEVPDADMANMQTVGDIVNFISSAL